MSVCDTVKRRSKVDRKQTDNFSPQFPAHHLLSVLGQSKIPDTSLGLLTFKLAVLTKFSGWCKVQREESIERSEKKLVREGFLSYKAEDLLWLRWVHCWTHFTYKYHITQIIQGSVSLSSGMEGWGRCMSPSSVWNNRSTLSPGAWDDPRWKGKLLLGHRPQRSRLYRALTHCHKQGQCCPPPHTSSTSVSLGAPSRKQPYENSRKRIIEKDKVRYQNHPVRQRMQYKRNWHAGGLHASDIIQGIP